MTTVRCLIDRMFRVAEVRGARVSCAGYSHERRGPEELDRDRGQGPLVDHRSNTALFGCYGAGAVERGQGLTGGASRSMGSRTVDVGPFRLAPREGVRTRKGAPVSRTCGATDLLFVLGVDACTTADRAELCAFVWPDVVVSEANLRVNTALRRKAVGDNHDGSRDIITPTRRGYRIPAPVHG
jgi:DNA-binding winged helix-turn-helix (wHTH) protein